jgi:hypothetical protein
VKRNRIYIGSAFALTWFFVSICAAADGPKPLTIHQAAQAGDANAVSQLLAAGANPDVLDANQCAPLFYAVKGGSSTVVALLLQKGANPDQPGPGGITPRALAEANATRYVTVLTLLRTGVAPNADGQRGRRGPLGMPNTPAMNPAAAAPVAPVPPQQGRPADANAAIQAILADANTVLARVAALPDVNGPLKTLDEKARTEEHAWALRTTDNRRTLATTVEHQFADEMTEVRKIADGEKANGTVKAVAALMAKRQKRHTAIADELRTQAQNNPQSSTRGSTRGRGASTASRGRGANEPAPMPEQPARAMAPRRPQDANQAAGDPEFDKLVQAWGSANYEDKRDLLKTVHDLDLKELEGLNESAQQENAAKTKTAIEGLMVMRQQRYDRINAAMEKEDARLQRLQDRPANTNTNTRGRGTTGRGNTGRGGR